MIVPLLLAMLATDAALEAPGETVHPQWQDFEPTFVSGLCPFHGQVEYDPEIIKCGRVAVPEDRGDPDSRLISLAVMRVQPITEGAPAVARLEGGPGGAGVTAARARLFSEGAGDLVRAVAEYIYFDQRGVGASEAHFCRGVRFPFQNGVELNPSGQEASRQQLVECLAQARRRGTPVEAYSTWHNALDVRDLRRALGLEQWTLYGVSYGSELAQATMVVDAEGVKGAILDSVVPIQPMDGGGWGAELAGTHTSLRALADACNAEPDCEEAYGDLYERALEIFAGLDEEPLVVEGVDPFNYSRGRVVVDGDLAARFIFLLLYDAKNYGDIPVVLDVLARRDENAMRVYANNVRFVRDLSWGHGLMWVVRCRGESMRVDDAQAAALLEAHPRLGAFMNPKLDDETCERVLPEATLDPAVGPFASAIPSLVLAGEMDPITAPPMAKAVAARLSRSTYLEAPYTGHGVLASSDMACQAQVVGAFARAPEAPLDTTCVTDAAPPDFTTDVRFTSGAFQLLSGLGDGEIPPVPALVLVAMLLALFGFPLAGATRIIEGRRAGCRTATLARVLSTVAALVCVLAVALLARLAIDTAQHHPLLIPAGWPGVVHWTGLTAVFAAVLSVLGIVSCFRATKCPAGTRISTLTVSVLTVVMVVLLSHYGAGPL